MPSSLGAAIGRAQVDRSISRAVEARANGDFGELAGAAQPAQVELRVLPLISLESGELVSLEALVLQVSQVAWMRQATGREAHATIH